MDLIYSGSAAATRLGRREGDRINSNQLAFGRRSYLDLRWRLQLRWRAPKGPLEDGL